MSGTAVSAPSERGAALTLRLARDDRLARMAASGDSRAFATIYERYHQPIYRYCYSILQDPDDAADALQNAMLKAMRSLERTERDIALKPWLFRIAHNEAISLVRRRRPTTDLETVDGPLAVSAAEDAATRERLGQLVDDLRELPDRQRGALLMRELAGLGFQEIGDIFGVSPAAAKQTVYEARTALHEYVDGRAMKCEDARQSLSARDRRMLRGRKLAAHLRDCASCRDFEEIMRTRTRDVAALAPPLSAGASAAILQGIVGGGGGAAGGGGIIGWLSGGAAKAVLGSQAKSMLAAALITAGAGALGVVSALETPHRDAAPVSAPASDTSQAPDASQLRDFDYAGPAVRQPDARRSARHSAQVSDRTPSGGARQGSQSGGSSGGSTTTRTVQSTPQAPASATTVATVPTAPTTTAAPALPPVALPLSPGTPALPAATPAITPPTLNVAVQLPAGPLP